MIGLRIIDHSEAAISYRKSRLGHERVADATLRT
jgi:hypothetical protein